MEIKLNGNNLSIEKIKDILANNLKIVIPEEVKTRVIKGEKTIKKILDKGRPVYGINTGFGEFSNVAIDAEKLSQLQINLIRSHSVGSGERIDKDTAKIVFLLRINTLLKGFSGISWETLSKMIWLFNNDYIPVIYSKGSVGASGDLVPLAHMALALIGEGEFYSADGKKTIPAKEVYSEAEIAPVILKAKEGLALINGTQYMTGQAVRSLIEIEKLLNLANLSASFSIDAYRGTLSAFDERIHKLRNQIGQQLIASHIRKLLQGSEILDSHKDCKRVQDPYSIRCIPQVHGAILDTFIYVKGVIEKEINAVTDNPLIFPETMEAISGGNFHGEPIALVLDFMAIALSELGSISERRIDLLLRAPEGTQLPKFLVKEGGLNSGFMIPQYVAAALVNENKVLSHPASVDSIPTSANKEDHVSMGATSANKLKIIINNVYRIISIEILSALQGVDFHTPLKTSPILEKVKTYFREKVSFMEKDRVIKKDLDKIENILRGKEIFSLFPCFEY